MAAWVSRHEVAIAVVGFSFFLLLGLAMIVIDGGVGQQTSRPSPLLWWRAW